MSANFLDTSGYCDGMDPHMFIGIGPLGAPVPVPMVPHRASCPHKWKTRDWRIAKSVTTRGNPVLQSGWAMLLVIHAPPLLPPHSLESVQLAGIIAASSAAPQISAHKVTGEKSPLCTEIHGCGGLNLDCSDLIGASVDVNENTVMTQPTAGDYVAALLSTVMSAIYSWSVNQVIGTEFPTSNAPVANEVKKYAENVLKAALASTSVTVIQTILDYLNSVVATINDPVAQKSSDWSTKVQQIVDGE